MCRYMNNCWNSFLKSFECLRSQNTTDSQMLRRVEHNGGSIFKMVKNMLWTFFLSISMAYNVIKCRQVLKNTQISKIA